MTSNSKRTVLTVVGLIALAMLALSIYRGGLIAWIGLMASVGLLGKILFKPARVDLGLAAGLAIVLLLAWFGARYYVISTWESGEVVELAIDTGEGTHVARLWVLEVSEHPVVYYDAEPLVAQALLDGKPVQFTRAGDVSTRIPKAVLADTLPEAEANRIFDAMLSKYGSRNDAADVYYGLLGRLRDRVAVIVELLPTKVS